MHLHPQCAVNNRILKHVKRYENLPANSNLKHLYEECSMYFIGSDKFGLDSFKMHQTICKHEKMSMPQTAFN